MAKLQVARATTAKPYRAEKGQQTQNVVLCRTRENWLGRNREMEKERRRNGNVKKG